MWQHLQGFMTMIYNYILHLNRLVSVNALQYAKLRWSSVVFTLNLLLKATP